MWRGKTIYALLAVKIRLENRGTKGTRSELFEKKQKNDLKVTAESKKWDHARVAQKGQDATETAPMEKAEVVGPTKPSRWW